MTIKCTLFIVKTLVASAVFSVCAGHRVYSQGSTVCFPSPHIYKTNMRYFFLPEVDSAASKVLLPAPEIKRPDEI